MLCTELEKTVRGGCGKGGNQQFSLGHVEIPIRDLGRDVNLKVSVTHQGNIAEDGLCIECEARDPEGVERTERPN